MKNDPREKLPRGTLEHLILRGISRAPQHGYALARWIEQRSEGAILVEEGSLYPAMHRLEKAGYLSSAWGEAESGRRAKIYSITRRGEAELVDRNERWRELTGAIALVLRCLRPSAPTTHGPAPR